MIKFLLPLEKQLKALEKTDNWHGVLGVCEDFFVIALCIFLTSQSFLFYPLALILIGARQRGLASLLHESAHGCLAKSKLINHILGTYFSGYLIFQSRGAYYTSHVKAHHGFLGDPQKDPDYVFHREAGLYDTPKNKKIFWPILRTLLFLNVPAYFLFLMKYRLISFYRHPKEILGFCLFWCGILAVLFVSGFLWEFLLFWIVPLVTVFPLIGWFIELAEHYPLLKNPTQNALYKTRNRMSHWMEAPLFSIHQENYHLVHHLRPKIPYWNYAKAHKIMMQDSEYALWNNKQGGVFVSSQATQGVVLGLLREN